MFKSEDGGTSWTAGYRNGAGTYAGYDRSKSIGLEVTSCWGLVENIDNPDIRHGLWTDIGGFHSPDRGKTWVHSTRGAPRNWTNTLYGVAMDRKRKGCVWGAWAQRHDIPYDGYVNGVIGAGGCLRSNDYGLTWVQPYTPSAISSSGAEPIPNPNATAPVQLNCTDIVYDSDKEELYICLYGQGSDTNPTQHTYYYECAGVWKSCDQGVTWKNKSKGLDAGNSGNMHVYRLKQGKGGALYAPMTAYRSKREGRGGLYKSTNGAETWVKIGPVNPDPFEPKVASSTTPQSGDMWCWWPTSFTFGKTEDEIYVTAVDNVKDKTAGLMVTYDGGKTWKSLWKKETESEEMKALTTSCLCSWREISLF